MSNLSEKFPLVLRELRESKGLSQEALAGRAELNRSYLGEIERGAAMPSLATIVKLAIALEIKLSDLIASCEEKVFESA